MHGGARIVRVTKALGIGGWLRKKVVQRRLPRGIRFYLFALTITLTVPLIIGSLLLAQHTSSSLDEVAASRMAERNRSITNAIDGELLARKTALRVMADTNLLNINTPAAVSSRLYQRLGGVASLFGGQITIWNRDARRFLSTASPFSIDDDFMEPSAILKEALEHTFERRATTISNSYRSWYNDEMIISILHPVIRNEEVIAVMDFTMSVEAMQARMIVNGILPNTHRMILDGSMCIVAQYGDPDPSLSAVFPLLRTRTGLFEFDGQNGVVHYAVTRSVQSPDWLVVASATQAALDIGDRRFQIMTLMIVNTAVFMIGLFFAVRVTDLLVNPTSGLLQQARGIRQGEGVGPLSSGVMEYDALGEELRSTERMVSAVGRRMEMIISNTGIGVWEGDCESGIHLLSPSMFALLNMSAPADCLIHRSEWLALIHPDDHDRIVAAITAARSSLHPVFQFTYRIMHSDGSHRWLEIIGRFEDKNRARAVGIAIDVTGRMEMEERRHLLAREVDHRAKNLLVLAQSVVKMAHADDMPSLKAVIEKRLLALGRSHMLTSENGRTATPITTIVHSEAGNHRGRYDIEGPDVLVAASAVQPLSMIVHELTTNAIKYGALSRLEGRVAVTWSIDASGLCMVWSEIGGPAIPAPPQCLGFGSRMIKINARQLGGSYECMWESTGLRCIVRIPAKHIHQNKA